MQMVFWYAIISALVVSLIAIGVAIPFLMSKKVPKKTLVILMSLSVGTLLGAVFTHFLPEAFAHGYTLGTAIYIVVGFLVLFVVEKAVHYHHHHGDKSVHGHSHGYTLGPVNIAGEAVHNFIDGLVIAGSYIVSIPLGIAATISIILHEVPQEIADFGVLLYSGYSKRKALFFNFLSGATAIVGVIVGFLIDRGGFASFILPFAAGNLLYIAAANLTPELHQHCGVKESFIHISMIIVGFALMVALLFTGFGHAH